jgi:hypothetical protein
MIESLARSGSLFIWHLKLESKILYDPSDFVKTLYESVVPYSGYEKDIATYEQITLDVARKFNESSSLNGADLHALFVALRNTCLLLTMSKGAPVFARKAAAEAAQKLFPMLPHNLTAYELLANEHLRYTRNASLPEKVFSGMEQKALIDYVLGFVEGSRLQLLR